MAVVSWVLCSGRFVFNLINIIWELYRDLQLKLLLNFVYENPSMEDGLWLFFKNKILKTFGEGDERDFWEAMETDHCSVLFCALLVPLYERTKYYPRESTFFSHQNPSGFRNKGPIHETDVWWKTEMLQCTNLFDARCEHPCYRIFRHMLPVSLTVLVYPPTSGQRLHQTSSAFLPISQHCEFGGIYAGNGSLIYFLLEIKNADLIRTLYILLQ